MTWLIISAFTYAFARYFVWTLLFRPHYRRNTMPFRRATNSDLIEIAGSVEARSKLAVMWNDGTRKVWLPLSQVELADDEKSVLVPEWLAQAKELI